MDVAWYRRYLDMLGLEPAPPSLANLNAIVRAHREIPFESISSLMRRAATMKGPVPPLDLNVGRIMRSVISSLVISSENTATGRFSSIATRVAICIAIADLPMPVSAAMMMRFCGFRPFVHTSSALKPVESPRNPSPLKSASTLAVTAMT